MDILSSVLLYLAILYISFTLLYLLFHKSKPRSVGFNPPPGKTGWPIIGETLQFAMAGSRGTPERFITDRTSKYSENVFQTSLLGENMAFLCGASGNKFIFSNQDIYFRSWWPRSVKILTDSLTKYIDETRHARVSIHEFVKPEALQNYTPIMDSMAKQHLENEWSPHKEVKAFPLVKKFTFSLACRLFMNIEDPDPMAKLAQAFETFAAGVMSLPVNFPGMKAGKIIQKELMAIIRQRDKELTDDRRSAAAGDQEMLSRMLLTEHDNDSFTKETLIANSFIALLIASHETTSSAITTCIRYLAEFPDVYDQVLKEQMEIAKSKAPNKLLNWEDIQKMKYSWMVACEALRLHPPSAGSFREVIADFTFFGFTISKGWKTFWSVHSTHKNPKYFPDPYRFDPSRFEGLGPAPYTFVPFGGGPKMCPGREYARAQILVFMHNLVIKFRLTKVIPDEKIIYTSTAFPAKGLPVRIEPHI